MTKEELRNLQRVIQRTEIYLIQLQKMHNRETGRDFVIDRPIDWVQTAKKTAKEILDG